LTRKHLLDVNVVIALVEPGHQHFQRAQKWFSSFTKGTWGLCPLTEAAFLRITTNPAFQPGPRSMQQAIAVLQMMKSHPRHLYWNIGDSWVDITTPFARRILGHQQVTDAFLLGLAIKEDGVLVTFDRGLGYLAASEFEKNLLVLE
jgi:toxin-antitoxin system PIN domain toxin